MNFISLSLTYDYVVEKNSTDISSESTHQIHSQKIMHTPRKGLYQSCSKTYEIWNFGFLPILFRFH